MIYCCQCESESSFDYTGTEWPLIGGTVPCTPGPGQSLHCSPAIRGSSISRMSSSQRPQQSLLQVLKEFDLSICRAHHLPVQPFSHNSPCASRDLRYSGQTLSSPGNLPLRSFLTILGTSAWVMHRSTPGSPAFAPSAEDT